VVSSRHFNLSPFFPLCFTTWGVWDGMVANKPRSRFVDGTSKAAADTQSAGDEETVFKSIVQCASRRAEGISGNERSGVREGAHDWVCWCQ
jgi:hypothetical protein